MKLRKELVDEVIRFNKKYYKTGNTYIVPEIILQAIRKAVNELKQNDKATRYVVDLIAELAKFSQRSGKGTYEDIYKALEVFGVIVE